MYLATVACSPERVGGCHATNEVTDLPGERRSTVPTTAALPPPVEAEALAVPANHGLGLDDHESGAPIGPEPREPHPEQTVASEKVWTSARAKRDSELLPQGEVFGDEGGAVDQEEP